MTTYYCTDDASVGVEVKIEAAAPQAALAEYIADALRAPDAYNQGEDGVGHRIRAYALGDDGTAWEDDIQFPALWRCGDEHSYWRCTRRADSAGEALAEYVAMLLDDRHWIEDAASWERDVEAYAHAVADDRDEASCVISIDDIRARA